MMKIKTEDTADSISADITVSLTKCNNCMMLEKKLERSRCWNRFFKEKLINIDKFMYILSEYEHEKQKNLDLQLAYDQRSREWNQQQEQLISLLHEIQPLREKLKDAEESALQERKARLQHQDMEESLNLTIEQLKAKISHIVEITKPVFVTNLEKKLLSARSDSKKLKHALECSNTEIAELRSYVSNNHALIEKLQKKFLWALQLGDTYGKLLQKNEGETVKDQLADWENLQSSLTEVTDTLRSQYNTFKTEQEHRLEGRRLELTFIPGFLVWLKTFEKQPLENKGEEEDLADEESIALSDTEKEANELEKLLIDSFEDKKNTKKAKVTPSKLVSRKSLHKMENPKIKRKQNPRETELKTTKKVTNTNTTSEPPVEPKNFVSDFVKKANSNKNIPEIKSDSLIHTVHQDLYISDASGSESEEEIFKKPLIPRKRKIQTSIKTPQRENEITSNSVKFNSGRIKDNSQLKDHCERLPERISLENSKNQRQLLEETDRKLISSILHEMSISPIQLARFIDDSDASDEEAHSKKEPLFKTPLPRVRRISQGFKPSIEKDVTRENDKEIPGMSMKQSIPQLPYTGMLTRARSRSLSVHSDASDDLELELPKQKRRKSKHTFLDTEIIKPVKINRPRKRPRTILSDSDSEEERNTAIASNIHNVKTACSAESISSVSDISLSASDIEESPKKLVTPVALSSSHKKSRIWVSASLLSRNDEGKPTEKLVTSSLFSSSDSENSPVKPAASSLFSSSDNEELAENNVSPSLYSKSLENSQTSSIAVSCSSLPKMQDSTPPDVIAASPTAQSNKLESLKNASSDVGKTSLFPSSISTVVGVGQSGHKFSTIVNKNTTKVQKSKLLIDSLFESKSDDTSHASETSRANCSVIMSNKPRGPDTELQRKIVFQKTARLPDDAEYDCTKRVNTRSSFNRVSVTVDADISTRAGSDNLSTCSSPCSDSSALNISFSENVQSPKSSLSQDDSVSRIVPENTSVAESNHPDLQHRYGAVISPAIDKSQTENTNFSLASHNPKLKFDETNRVSLHKTHSSLNKQNISEKAALTFATEDSVISEKPVWTGFYKERTDESKKSEISDHIWAGFYKERSDENEKSEICDPVWKGFYTEKSDETVEYKEQSLSVREPSSSEPVESLSAENEMDDKTHSEEEDENDVSKSFISARIGSVSKPDDSFKNTKELEGILEELLLPNKRKWSSLIQRLFELLNNVTVQDPTTKLQPLVRCILNSLAREDFFDTNIELHRIPETVFKYMHIARILEINFHLPKYYVSNLISMSAHKFILTPKIRANSIASLTCWFLSSFTCQYNDYDNQDADSMIYWARAFIADLLFYHVGNGHKALLTAINCSGKKAFIRMVRLRNPTALEDFIFWIIFHGQWHGEKLVKSTLIDDARNKLGLYKVPAVKPDDIMRTVLNILTAKHADGNEKAVAVSTFLLIIQWMAPMWTRSTFFSVLEEILSKEVQPERAKYSHIKNLFSGLVKRGRWNMDVKDRFLEQLDLFLREDVPG